MSFLVFILSETQFSDSIIAKDRNLFLGGTEGRREDNLSNIYMTISVRFNWDTKREKNFFFYEQREKNG